MRHSRISALLLAVSPKIFFFEIPVFLNESIRINLTNKSNGISNGTALVLSFEQCRKVLLLSGGACRRELVVFLLRV